jgi:outer membrane protein
MKNVLFTALFLLSLCSGALAQATKKGSMMIGTTTELLGSANTLTSSTASFAIINGQVNNFGNSRDLQRTTSFNINPTVAYFLLDGLAIGAKLGFDYTKFEDEDDPSILVDAGTIVRYYIDLGNVKPFAQTNFSLGRSQEGSDDVDKRNLFEFGVSAGAAFFFNDYVSIDVLLGYRFDRSRSVAFEDNTIDLNSFGLGLGFSFFID